MSHALHKAFIEDASRVREALAECNRNSFEMSIIISGRTMSDADECKITYTVSSGYENSVKGDSTEACLEELMRRLGWHKLHEPLALAKPRTKERAKVISDAHINADNY